MQRGLRESSFIIDTETTYSSRANNGVCSRTPHGTKHHSGRMPETPKAII